MEAKFSVLLLTAAPPGLGRAGEGALVKVDGREALLRSIELFLNRGPICQIQVVLNPEVADAVRQRHGAHFSFSGVRVAVGGPRWIDQIVAGAQRLSDEATHVLVHDAARVLVPSDDLENLIDASASHDATALVAPVRSTLLQVDESGSAMASHLPSEFMQLLTPQGYARRKYLEMVTNRREIHPSQLHLVRGSSLNVRLGGDADVPLVKALSSAMPRPKLKNQSNPFEEAQW